MTYAQPLGGLGRLLMVIPWLIKERVVPIREMERRFAIKPEQLVKDMEALNEVDFFVSPEQRFSVEITGEHVKVMEAPEFPATPGFLPFEALGCLVAAKAALEMNPEASDLASAVEKLEKAMIPNAAKALRIFSAARAPWVNQLREWATDRRVVRLRYRSTDKGEISDREVEPWQVYQWMGTWYLWGFSRTKGEPRRYRVDGIQRAKPTGEGFRPPRRVPPPPTTYRRGPNDHRVVFLIRPPARWITEHYSMQVLSEDPEGVATAEFYTRDPRVAARLALRLGPNIHIVEGSAARRELATLAAAVLGRYGCSD
ncbi:MAG: WYL domain-containing protein [bacterium]|nr:WYL domain-containing protein [Acidimicrobiia bacterium]MCY4649492.1 WYL domain-containing protein [bacterium]